LNPSGQQEQIVKAGNIGAFGEDLALQAVEIVGQLF